MLTDAEMEISLAVKTALAGTRPRRSAEWLAEHMGIGVNRLRNIIQGRTPAEEDDIDKIRRSLRLPDHWPHESRRADGARKGETVSFVGTPLKSIQIVGSASAGPGVWNVDVESLFVRVPASIAELGTVGFIVDGDSMMPMLREFDAAVFKERRKLLHGYIFLVKLPDESYIVKRSIFERNDWYLESLNRNYERFALPKGAQVIGLLVGWYRVRGTRESFDADAEGLLPDDFS